MQRSLRPQTAASLSGPQTGSTEIDPAASALAAEIAAQIPGPEAFYVLDLVHTDQVYKFLELRSSG